MVITTTLQLSLVARDSQGCY